MSATQLSFLPALVVCLALVWSAVIDLRRGWVGFVWGSSAQATRDATPILYWIALAFKLGAAAFIVGLLIDHGGR